MPRQLVGRRPRRRARRSAGGAHHAGAGADEHELPQLLRDLAHPRLERRPQRAGARAHRAPARPRDPAQDARAVAVARRPACSAGSPTSATTASATCTPPRTRRSAAAWCATSPRSAQQSNFGTLLDIVIADELRTVLWPIPQDDDGELVGPAPRGVERPARHDRRLRRRRAPRPHVRRAVHHALPRRLPPRPSAGLARAAVQLITSKPAALFGLRDRGVLREGAIADLVLFDPETIGSDDATLVADLPGDSARLTAGSQGIERVLVGGVAGRRGRRGDRRHAGRGAALRARHRHRHRPLTGAFVSPRRSGRRATTSSTRRAPCRRGRATARTR